MKQPQVISHITPDNRGLSGVIIPETKDKCKEAKSEQKGEQEVEWINGVPPVKYPSLKDWASCLINMRQSVDWSDHVSTGVLCLGMSRYDPSA